MIRVLGAWARSHPWLTTVAVAAIVMVGVAVVVGGARRVADERIVAGSPTGPIEGPRMPGFLPVRVGERLGLSRRVQMGRIGERENAVYVMRDRQVRRPRQIIIWLHGYGTNHVGGSQLWLAHLAAQGTVIFPAYARAPYPVGERFSDLAWPLVARALRSALSKLDYDPERIIVGGYSFGGTLTNDYAVNWAAEGLPRPAGIFSVYAGRSLKNGPVLVPVQRGEVSSKTEVVALASVHDLLARTAEGRRIYAAAERALARRLIIVRKFELGDHFAPTRTTRFEQAQFWRPLDALIARVNDRADRAEAARRPRR